VLSLTYLSSATDLFDDERLAALMSDTRPRNEARGLTGMLLYSDGNFIQVLEGPDEAVEQTFRSISADPRHRGIIVALRDQVEARAFPDWSMAFRSVDPDDVRRLPGYSEFLTSWGRDRIFGDRAAAAYQMLEIFRDSLR
jgi:hypothetical protein